MRAIELNKIIGAISAGGTHALGEEDIAALKQHADSMERGERHAVSRTDAQHLADAIGRYVNGAREPEQQALITALNNEHRTLQAKVAELALNWIMQVRGPAFVDGRNEIVERASKRIVWAFKEDGHFSLATVKNEAGCNVTSVRFPCI